LEEVEGLKDIIFLAVDEPIMESRLRYW